MSGGYVPSNIGRVRYQDVGTGLQNVITGLQNREQQQMQDYGQSLKDMRPIAEQQTISGVLNNVNEAGGFQTGLSTQTAISDQYNSILQQKTADEAALDKAEYEANKEITQYDSNGSAIKSPDLSGIQKARSDLNTMYDNKIGTLNSALQGQYAKDPQFLNAVTDPADTEQRLVSELMSKGVSADVARSQAKQQMAPYYPIDMTTREKAQFDLKLKLLDQIKPDTIQSGNRAAGSGSGSTGTRSSGKYDTQKYLDTKKAVIGDAGYTDDTFSFGTDKVKISRVMDRVNAQPDIHPDALFEAVLATTTGEADRWGSFDPQATSEDNLTNLAREITTKKGLTSGKGGNFTNVTTRQYNPQSQAERTTLLRDLSASLGGGNNKTIDDVLGKDFTDAADLRYTDLPAQAPKAKEEAPNKSGGKSLSSTLFTGKDNISKAMNSPKTGEVKKRLYENPDSFLGTYNKMDKEQKGRIEKVLGGKPADVLNGNTTGINDPNDLKGSDIKAILSGDEIDPGTGKKIETKVTTPTIGGFTDFIKNSYSQGADFVNDTGNKKALEDSYAILKATDKTPLDKAKALNSIVGRNMAEVMMGALTTVGNSSVNLVDALATGFINWGLSDDDKVSTDANAAKTVKDVLVGDTQVQKDSRLRHALDRNRQQLAKDQVKIDDNAKSLSNYFENNPVNMPVEYKNLIKPGTPTNPSDMRKMRYIVGKLSGGDTTNMDEYQVKKLYKMLTKGN